MDKSALRAECLEKRARMDTHAAVQASGRLCAHLLNAIAEPAIVAGYRPVRGEIDPSEALQQLAARGHTLCLPVVEGALLPLFFRRWEFGEKLEKGRYDIDVPPVHQPHLMPDVVIVPLVAFDAKGHRLGYGAGYYDRTIHALRQAKAHVQIIGAAYASQQADSIPAAAHDERLDAVVTENGMVRFA